MASLETLQLMICHLWTAPSILVRKDILVYEFFQTCLLENTAKEINISFPEIFKNTLSSTLYYQYINPGKGCESFLVIRLKSLQT